MPFEKTPPAIAVTTVTALATDIQTNIDLLVAFNINLTKSERQGGNSVGPKRLPFMMDYYGNKNDFPTLKPPFMNEMEANAHWEVVGLLANIKTKTAKLDELVDDPMMNSEHFAHDYALEGYAIVQRGKEQNVPGADTFHDMLKVHFEAMGNSNGTTPEEPTTPPVTPTPGTTS